ncbi:hypothetical protein, partial [Lysinibacillus sp. 54212]|uniref:hypothetical protein n=1 Tax=Lysinibacillus sp. 54212 TaxID=3119829 RepID=UPI002FCB1A0B
YFGARDGSLIFSFYNEQGNLINEVKHLNYGNMVNFAVSVQTYDVKKVVITSIGNIRISELDFDNLEIFNPVENISVDFTNRSDSVDAVLNWKNPYHTYLSDIQVNGESIGITNNYTLTDLKHDQNQKITITTVYGAKNTKIDAFFDLTTPRDIIGPKRVGNFSAVQNDGGVLLKYDLPPEKDFSHVKITRDGMTIKDNYEGTTFLDSGVILNRKYVYRIVTYDVNNNIGEVAEVEITVVSDEVTKLSASTEADRVKLTWNNSMASGFEKVIIYRKEKENLVGRFLSLFSSEDGYRQIFTTNGTTFEDLTVASDTAYTYKLTSMIASTESNGVTIDVKTQKPQISGGNITPQPSDPNDPNSPPDSYVVKWTSPKTGKLKVLIGGIDYKTVNAADLKVVIPANDMKFDKFGNFDVQLVIIDENGNEIGVPSNPGSSNITWGGVNLGDLGLDAKSALTVAAALICLIGLILLLAMSFRVAPKLISLIKNSFK